MIIIFFRVLSIFVMVLLGFLSGFSGRIPTSSTKSLSFIVAYICTPCLIFNAITSQQITNETLKPAIEISIGTVIFYIIGSISLFFLFKAIKFSPTEEIGTYIVTALCVNSGFMGFPITQSIFGDLYLFFIVFNNIISTAYYYVIAIYIMNYGSQNTGRSLKTALRPLISPVMISIFLGVFVAVLRTPVHPVISDLSKMIGDATSFLSMFVLGIQLSNSDFKAMFKNTRILAVSGINLVIVPLITTTVVYFLPITTAAKLTLALSATFPTAVAISTVAENENKNPVLTSQIVSATTLFSLATLPVWISIISRLFY